MESREDDIFPRIRKKIESLKWDSRLCVPIPAKNEKFQVKSRDDQYVVSLLDMTCSCGAWQLTGIACIHGVSSIGFLRRNVEDYVDKYFQKDMYMEAYKGKIEPLNGPKMWPEVEGYPVRPPPFKRMPGRPKTSRKKSGIY